MTELTDEDRIIAGIEAKRLLDSKIIDAAVHAIEGQAIEELVATEAIDDLKRARLVERVRAIRDVKSAIESIRMTGKIAAQNSGAAFD